VPTKPIAWLNFDYKKKKTYFLTMVAALSELAD
jgi:hypothetical protein